MNISIVQTSMRDENSIGCNLARIKKDEYMILIIHKENECAIYDYQDLTISRNFSKYLLLKHYENPTYAYKDFLKLIGKMCKKSVTGKYFMNHIEEDNRIIFENFENEHMITKEERITYKSRYDDFLKYVADNIRLIDLELQA